MDKIGHGREKAVITFSRPVLTKQGFGDMVLDLTIPVSNCVTGAATQRRVLDSYEA